VWVNSPKRSSAAIQPFARPMPRCAPPPQYQSYRESGILHHNMHNIENDTPPLISNLAHGVSNIRISNNRPSRDHYVCPQYLANHCNKGENCIFTHVLGNTNNLKSNRTPNSTKNSTNLVSMDIKSIRGKVATLAKDQQGCRGLNSASFSLSVFSLL